MNKRQPKDKPKIQWLAVREDGLSYLQCLHAAASEPNSIREFDRLNGTNLSLRGSGIELAIDNATGRLEHDLEKFCEFVWDYVFLRVPLATTTKTK